MARMYRINCLFPMDTYYKLKEIAKKRSKKLGMGYGVSTLVRDWVNKSLESCQNEPDFDSNHSGDIKPQENEKNPPKSKIKIISKKKEPKT